MTLKKMPALFKEMDAFLEETAPYAPSARDDLYALMMKASSTHPELYRDWLVRFHDSPIRTSGPFGKTSSFQELKDAHESAPETLFYVDLTGQKSGNFTQRLLTSLLKSEHMRCVYGFVFNHHKMTDRMFETIAASKKLDSLVSLEFNYISTLRAQHILTLTSSANLTGLASLKIYTPSSEFGDQDVEQLAQDPNLGELTQLQLVNSGLTNASMRALADSESLASLRVLDVSKNSHINAQGMELLLKGSLLEGVRALNLNNCKIKDEGAVMLASSPLLSKLESLQLQNTGISEAGLEAIAASKHLSALTWVDAWGVFNAISAQGRAALEQPGAQREGLSIRFHG